MDSRPVVPTTPLPERSLSASAEVRSYFLFAALRRAAQYAFMRWLWRFLAAAVSFLFFRATVTIFLLLPGGRPLRDAVPWRMAIARSNRSLSAMRSFRASVIASRAYQAGRGIRNNVADPDQSETPGTVERDEVAFAERVDERPLVLASAGEGEGRRSAGERPAPKSGARLPSERPKRATLHRPEGEAQLPAKQQLESRLSFWTLRG